MDKKNLVANYQRARLEEWIGNFSEAQKIYNEIEKNDDKFGKVLIPSLHIRKKNINSEKHKTKTDKNGIRYAALKYMIEDYTDNNVLIYSDLIYNEKTLITRNADTDFKKGSFWKYSITIISKLEDQLKFDIRGFNPNGYIPKNLSIITLSFDNNWVIKERHINNNELLWYIIYSKVYDLKLYISIDKWGLLNGYGIIKENILGEGLFEINNLLANFNTN